MGWRWRALKIFCCSSSSFPILCSFISLPWTPKPSESEARKHQAWTQRKAGSSPASPLPSCQQGALAPSAQSSQQSSGTPLGQVSKPPSIQVQCWHKSEEGTALPQQVGALHPSRSWEALGCSGHCCSQKKKPGSPAQAAGPRRARGGSVKWKGWEFWLEDPLKFSAQHNAQCPMPTAGTCKGLSSPPPPSSSGLLVHHEQTCSLAWRPGGVALHWRNPDSK